MIFIPIGHGILIEEVKSEDALIQIGNIFMQNVDTFKDKTATTFKGKVVAKGMGMFDENNNLIPNALFDDVNVGDIVLCVPSGGTYITGKNRKKYKVEEVSAIIAKVDE